MTVSSALLALLLPIAAAAQVGQSVTRTPASSDPHGAAPRAAAARATQGLKIDGKLDDAAWAAATPITAFTQVDPDEGQPVSERTEVRIVYDNDAIYVGARLYDRGRVTARLGRRDMDRFDSDWFAFILDSYHDHQSSYVFLVNPLGVQRDAARTENNADPAWDAVWESAARIDAEGWAAEIRIPFSQLRFSRDEAQTWGIQMERDIVRRGELAVFSFVPKRENAGIGRYGHLDGISGIPTGKRLEVLPYVVARNERIDPGANPFRRDSEGAASSGVDVKYRVTSNLTLDATINPDFGQVEVDPAVVNLTAFETFFQEKRPFFLEGAGIFNFGIGAVGPGSAYRNLFYSRRIGRRPQLGAPSPYSDVADVSTILGAAKLTGRPAKGWSVGIVEALTQQEDARYRDLTTERDASIVAEPMTNYFVGRAIRQSANGMTRVGGLVTSVNRADDERASQFLRDDAFSGGIDFSHEWARRAWRVSGFLTGSHVTGSPQALANTQRSAQRYYQRPDADHLELDPSATSLSGLAGQAQIFKQSGLHWIGDLGAYAVSPGYEVNDLGFQSRADQLGVNGRLIYQENKPGRTMRNYMFWSAFGYNTNFDLLSIGNTIDGGFSTTLLNFHNVGINGGVSFGTNDDRLTRGGPLSRTSTVKRLGLNYSSNFRKNTTYNANAFVMRWESGGYYNQLSAGLALKPRPSLNLSIGPNFQSVFDPGQWLTTISDANASHTFGRRYVFADLHQKTLALDTRVNVTFSPNLSLQVYAQPFISSAQFGMPKEFKTPGEFAFNDYSRVGSIEDRGTSYRIDPDGGGPSAPFSVAKQDFNVRSLRGNAVLRWQWRPGSTIYLAWQQMRQDFAAGVGDFSLNRDRKALFNAAPDNVFLVKLSYWLNP